MVREVLRQVACWPSLQLPVRVGFIASPPQKPDVRSGRVDTSSSACPVPLPAHTPAAARCCVLLHQLLPVRNLLPPSTSNSLQNLGREIVTGAWEALALETVEKQLQNTVTPCFGVSHLAAGQRFMFLGISHAKYIYQILHLSYLLLINWQLREKKI